MAAQIGPSQSGLAALKVAQAKVGIREVPPGSNWGVAVSRILWSVGIHSPAPWCLAFVHYCFELGGKTLGGGGLVQAFQDWAVANGEIVTRPYAGDCVCYDWDSDGWADHVGIVEKVLALRWKGRVFAGWVATVEGNTSSGVLGSQSDGDGVYRRRRWVGTCKFVRVAD